MNKTCKECGSEFSTNRYRQIFCTKDCNRADSQRRTGCLSRFGKELATSTVGAIGELEVSCDLLKKGYEVFRAISPASSCDLAVLKNGKLLRIEVRTGYVLRSGKLIFTKNKSDNKHDHYAVPTINGIVYIPEL